MTEELLPDHLGVGMDKETKLFHGLYYRNQPTPSGCNRFILRASTADGFATEKEAAEEIEKYFPHLEKISFSESLIKKS